MSIAQALTGLALLVAVPLPGQDLQPVSGDPRLQSIDYRADQVIRIRGAVGYQIAIELAPDEIVRSIALGDSGAWLASVDKAGNRLFLKPLVAGAETNMTVVTDVRTYAFDLVGAEGVDATTPYTIRFRYPSASMTGMWADPAALPTATMIGRYRLGGDRVLRPATISDDGLRTFIAWPADAPLPATYIRDVSGQEMLANGYMRGSFYVLDSVEPHLVFRIDRRTARADRLPPEARP